MKSLIIILLFNCISYTAVCQFLLLNDSLKVEFLENRGTRIVISQNDLNYRIVFTNMSHRTIKSYTKLVFDDAPSPFANYYWDLYQKVDSDLQYVPRVYHSSAWGGIFNDLSIEYGDVKKADSAIAVFDIEKKDLFPFQSDTLVFNFLSDIQRLAPGEYGFQVFLRVGDTYAIHYGRRESVSRSYLSSERYRIKVLKPLESDMYKLLNR